MSAPSITVYSKPTGCQQCIATKRWLDKRDIPYTLEDITTDENHAAALSLGYAQAPVVIATTPQDGERHWSGFDTNELERYHKAIAA